MFTTWLDGQLWLIVASFSLAATAVFGALWRTSRSRILELEKSVEQKIQKLEWLKQRASETDAELAFTKFKAQLFTDVITEDDVRKAITLVLRRFIPNAKQGMAAVFELTDIGSGLTVGRGISEEGKRGVQFDPQWRTVVRPGEIYTPTARELLGSRFYETLPTADRQKLENLHLVGLGSGQKLGGVMVTTSLYPQRSPRETQVRMTSELMTVVSSRLGMLHDIETQSQELNEHKALLALRSIGDGEHASSEELFREYLRCLLRHVKLERAVIYLASGTEGQLSEVPLVTVGTHQPTYLRESWQNHEHRLASLCIREGQLLRLAGPHLREAGVDSLIGSAVILPLEPNRDIIGALVLTRDASEPVSAEAVSLAKWGAKYLCDLVTRVKREAKIEREARTDSLTSLGNRTVFDRQLQAELRQTGPGKPPVSLLLLDLDHFKSVNDTHGHQAGDDALRAVADVLRDRVMNTRSSDRVVLARYGGEELAVVLPGVGGTGALRIADDIRRAIAEMTIESGIIRFKITTSIGIAVAPEDGHSPNRLIAAADAALYKAKETGRNRVCLASDHPEMSDREMA